MRFRGLDLNLLVALDALLDEQSVTRAGKRLHLTQSAMSDALGRLRSYFDDELLMRVGSRHALTPLAEELIRPVREVLIQIQGSIMDRSRFDPATCQRTFRLQISGFSLTVVIPQLLRQVLREAPDVRFELNLLREQPTQILDRAETDLLILGDGFESPGHPSELLLEDSFTCVIWEGNRRIGETLTRKAYIETGHVTRHGDYADRSPTLEEWFRRERGAGRRVEVVAASITDLPGLVVGTDRIATVPTRLAQWAQNKFPIRLLPSPIPTPPFVQNMLYHRSRANDPALSWLRRVLKEVLSVTP